MAPYGYAVHAPSGAACIVCESDDSPRIVPTVVLAELCRDLLAARTPATTAPAVAAPEPLRAAAQAVLDRWNSPRWEWAKQGPTADLMLALAGAIAQEPQQ